MTSRVASYKPFVAIVIAAFSCSIIQDGDITSPDGLDKLKLTAFQIIQTTNKGNGTVYATMTYDSVQNFTDAGTGLKIARKVEYSLPSLGTLKLKLRSGTTAKTRVHIYYTDTKKVFSMRILQQDSTVELYRFRYNSSGQLNKIVTFINPVDNQPLTVATNDSLIYSNTNGSNSITKIIRRSGGATIATVDIVYQTGGNNISYPGQFTFQSFTYNQQGGNCSDSRSNPYACSGYSAMSTGGGSGNTSANCTISVREVLNSLNQVALQDTKIGFNSSREYDTYYFHPTMLLRNQLSHGNELMTIYMMDWWVPGAIVTSANFIHDDYVTIKFDYGF